MYVYTYFYLVKKHPINVLSFLFLSPSLSEGEKKDNKSQDILWLTSSFQMPCEDIKSLCIWFYQSSVQIISSLPFQEPVRFVTFHPSRIWIFWKRIHMNIHCKMSNFEIYQNPSDNIITELGARKTLH